MARISWTVYAPRTAQRRSALRHIPPPRYVSVAAPHTAPYPCWSRRHRPLAHGPAGQDAGGGAREEERRRPSWRAALFNHLVGAQEERFRDRQPKCLRGLEIDNQLELGRLHDRQVSGLFPLENSADIDAGLAQHV
jgi:hypothetical protein